MFDIEGEGFIPVERFRTILKEVDEDFTEDELDDIIFEVGLIITIIIFIITTRPKPAYGRQGLAGSWDQDMDKVSNFWVFLTSHFAQLGIKPTWDHS